jgi:hypothetical protein
VSPVISSAIDSRIPLFRAIWIQFQDFYIAIWDIVFPNAAKGENTGEK